MTAYENVTHDQFTINTPATRTVRPQPVSAYLLRLAVVLVIAGFIASVIGLGIYAPTGGDGTVRSGPGLVAAVLGICAAMAGQILGFIAAVRSGHPSTPAVRQPAARPDPGGRGSARREPGAG